MKAKIPEKLWTAVGGEKTWKHYGVNEANREFSWRRYAEIDLEGLTVKRLERLAEMIEPHRKIRGAVMLLKDITAWIRVLKKDSGVKPRSVEQFASLLKTYIEPVPGHRVYERDEVGEVWFAYYVESIAYHPLYDSGRERRPPYVSMAIFWHEFGTRHEEAIVFHAEDCLHLTVPEALARQKYFVESDELRKEYLADVERWSKLVGKIGLQLRARGRASTDLDGNEEDRWGGYNKKTIVLDHNDEPAKLVVDVFKETDKVDRNDREPHMDLWFWPRRTMKLGTSAEDGEDDSYDELNNEDDSEDNRRGMPIEDVIERPEIEVPIHPMLACFDLRRHLRLRVHVGAVTVYEYDTKLASKLILPPDITSLVEMLVSRKGAFKDLVEGKSGGTVVLCAGPAGVGKTLTAEVYAESMSRPLYSVQCSQLGVKPEELEEELMCIFARSQRWNAILLLDEADVYVMARGEDIYQNAIVGVFLRVLEYYSGVLFMTTNRSDMVDDAIASRCVARIDYALPSTPDQRRLWRVLADNAGITIPDTVIEAVLRTHKALSGRDIKNLLKLGSMVSDARGTPIDAATVDFVSRFKPTTTPKEGAQ